MVDINSEIDGIVTATDELWLPKSAGKNHIEYKRSIALAVLF